MATYLSQELTIDNSGQLQRRIRHAVGHYAAYCVNSQDSTLKAWALKALPGTNCDLYANMMLRAVVEDGNFANANADTDAADTALQSIVETAINTTFKYL